MEKTFELAPQMRRASVQPASINVEARTVDVLWSTGAAVRTLDRKFYEVVNEELSLEKSAVRMERLNGGAPLLNCHDMGDLDKVLGVVERAWLDGNNGLATVRFHDDSKDREPKVEPIWSKVVNKIIRNVSVRYLVHKYRDITKKGDSIRTLLAIDWEPLELSAVAVGADPGAGFRSQPAKTSCRVISEDEPVIVPAPVIEEPAFDIQNVRFVDKAGKELSPEQIQLFMRSQAAKQIPAESIAPPDYRVLRARLALLKIA